MKRNLTAKDRVSAANNVMLIRGYCDDRCKAECDIRDGAFVVALSLENDPKVHRKQIEDGLSALAALEPYMDAYVLRRWYNVQEILGVSPISSLAQRAHDTDKGFGSAEWTKFVSDRRDEITGHTQVAA